MMRMCALQIIVIREMRSGLQHGRRTHQGHIVHQRLEQTAALLSGALAEAQQWLRVINF